MADQPTMGITWKDGVPMLEMGSGVLTTRSQVTALAEDLTKVAELMPDRKPRKSKGRAKSSRPTTRAGRKTKVNGDTEAEAAAST